VTTGMFAGAGNALIAFVVLAILAGFVLGRCA
jgi:hypothetical protein